MGTGVHVLDTLNYLMGSLPGRLCAFRDPQGEVIDATEHITLQYGSTIADVVSSRRMSNRMNHLNIFGTEGTLTVTGLFSTAVESSMIIDGKKIKDYRGTNMYVEEVKAFVNLVEGKESHIALGEDGYNVVRQVEEAYRLDSSEDLHSMEY